MPRKDKILFYSLKTLFHAIDLFSQGKITLSYKCSRMHSLQTLG